MTNQTNIISKAEDESAAANVLLTISWKYRPSWPKDVYPLKGYESVEEAHKQLKKRWPHKTFKNIPGGFKYEEPFNCQGERGTIVYSFTAIREGQHG